MRKSKTTWSVGPKDIPDDAHPGAKAIHKAVVSCEEKLKRPPTRDELVPEIKIQLRRIGVVSEQDTKRIFYYWRDYLVSGAHVKIGRVA